MEWVLVRHAEPAWVIDGRTVGDPDLTERGHRQAQHLAERLAGERIDAVWISDAVRAQSTARPLVERLGAQPITHPWLHEIKTPTLASRDPAEVDDFLDDRKQFPVPAWWDGFPGCEPVRDFVQRISDGFDAELQRMGATRVFDDEVELWQDLPDQRIVVVCHAGTAGAAITHLLGLRHVPWPWERFGLFHAAIAHVTALPLAGARAFTLQEFQDTTHLHLEDRTR